MTRLLSALCLLALTASACSTTSPDKTDETADTTEKPEPTTDDELTRDQIVAYSTEGELKLAALADGAKTYFMTEQLRQDSEPWHTYDSPDMQGMPVEWAEYTFPGGPVLTFSTHPSIPKAGEALPLMVTPSSDPLITAALATLAVDLSGEHHLRYTVTTGPDTGPGASVTLTAHADFNPASPEIHTSTIVMSIDPDTQEILVAPVFTENAYE